MGAIGIDVEKLTEEVDEKMWDLVCDDVEKQRLQNIPVSNRSEYCFSLFSAKESVIKCLYPYLSKKYWPMFNDISIELDLAVEQFIATVCGNQDGQFSGRIVSDNKYIYTGVWLGKQELNIQINYLQHGLQERKYA